MDQILKDVVFDLVVAIPIAAPPNLEPHCCRNALHDSCEIAEASNVGHVNWVRVDVHCDGRVAVVVAVRPPQFAFPFGVSLVLAGLVAEALGHDALEVADHC